LSSNLFSSSLGFSDILIDSELYLIYISTTSEYCVAIFYSLNKFLAELSTPGVSANDSTLVVCPLSF